VWPLGRVFLIYVFTRLNELWLQCSRHSTNPPHGTFLHMNELNFPTRRKKHKIKMKSLFKSRKYFCAKDGSDYDSFALKLTNWFVRWLSHWNEIIKGLYGIKYHLRMQCSVKHKWVGSRNEYFIALQGYLKR